MVITKNEIEWQIGSNEKVILDCVIVFVISYNLNLQLSKRFE